MRFSINKLIMLSVLGAALVLFPADGLRALGLGEARVDSYLGQPLDVTIRLIEADSAALDSLTVAPARVADYDRLGVPQDAVALGLEVNIDRRVDPPMIRVRSQRSVNDPVVQFLVDARWSSGRVLREYTLFIDPPTIDMAPPVTRPVAEERVTEDPPRPLEPPVTEPAPRPAPAAPAEPRERERITEPAPRPAAGPGEVIVGAGQTLWGIAYDWRADANLTMNQVMLAIFERNPQAFVDGNVNRLRRGAELDMPGVDDVARVSVDEADRRIRAQMQAWQQEVGRQDVPVVAEAAIPEVDRARQEREPQPEPEVVHRLEVVPPESDVFDEGPTVTDGEVRRASSRLSELEDQMYAEALESDQLTRQIASIREAINTREAAGLAVADEEMAELEARLREARLAREEAERLAAAEAAAEEDEFGAYFRQLEEELGVSDPTREEAPVETDPWLTDDPMLEEEPLVEEAVDDPAWADAPAEPAAEPAVVADDPAATTRGFGLWLWLLLALVVIALAGGAFAFLRMRGQASGDTGAATAGLSVADARERVQANPSKLTAHLALLHALAAKDRPEAFSDALDEMYRQVDDDNNPRWQEALNLAVVHAPNHPLLTPHETGLGSDDDEGLDDRTREMLGILGAPDDIEPDTVEPDDYELDSVLDSDEPADTDDDFFGAESDDRGPDRAQDTVRAGAKTPDDDDQDADQDLAALSSRLDEPQDGAKDAAGDDAEDELSFDFDDDELDETTVLAGDDVKDVGDKSAFDADDLDLDKDDPLRLDFDFSDKPSPGTSARSETLPLTGDIDVDSDDDDDDLDIDLDDLDDDLAASDDELVDVDEDADDDQGLNEQGDRELEAFLKQDGADADMGSDESTDSDLSQTSGTADEADDDDGATALSDEDAEVKLDLARAYLSMDDPDSARTLLEEIISGGSAAMRAEARKLLDEG